MFRLAVLRFLRQVFLTHPDRIYESFKGLIPYLITVSVLLALGCPTWALLALAYFVVSRLCDENDSPVEESDFSVSIVGGGFSGIAMGIRLQKMGVKYTIYEMAPSVGGVWFHNRYPGCACDVPSHLYSLSGELKVDWSRQYAPQEEILGYLQKLANDHKLNVKLNTRFISAKWHSDCHQYCLALWSGEKEFTVWSNALILGVGGLREGVTPEFSGSTSFEGTSFHSSDWDANFEYSGKKVAIIGTGASAVQIIPKICRDVEKLYVFQRTPTWSLKKHDFSFSKCAISLFELIPFSMKFYRLCLYLFFELRFVAFRNKYAYINNLLRYLLQLRTQYIVKNASLARALTPEYAPGCKQFAPSDDYFYSYKRDNVHLVVSPIQKLTTKGIEAQDGMVYAVDAIVYATGFSPLETGKRAAGNVCNELGKSLSEQYGEEPVAYFGICFEGFSNSFSLLGPNTGLGHNSVVFMIECQVNYVAQCIRYMIGTHRKSMTVKRSSMAWYERFLARQMPKNVFYEGCSSWYRTKNGEGTNYTMWPGSSLIYWWYTRIFNPDHYVFE